MDVLCIPESGCCCLFVPLFLHFSLSPIFQALKTILSHFSQELWGLFVWNLVRTWTVGRCMVYTGIRLLLPIHPFSSSFFFLSNFQTLKCFVTLFSGTLRPRRLKLGTHVDSGQMYRVYRNQAAASYMSLYFSFSFFSNFQRLKFFVTFFSGTVRLRRLKLCTHLGRCIMYTGIRLLLLLLICPFFFIFFLSSFQTLKFFVTFSQELRGLEGWNLVHTWTMGGCIVYTEIMLLLLFILFFFHFSFQLSSIKNFRQSFLWNCEA